MECSKNGHQGTKNLIPHCREQPVEPHIRAGEHYPSAIFCTIAQRCLRGYAQSSEDVYNEVKTSHLQQFTYLVTQLSVISARTHLESDFTSPFVSLLSNE